MRKPKLKISKDGKLRRTRVIEIRFTEEEETLLDLMWMNFIDGAIDDDPRANLTFEDYLAVLLRRHIDQERADIQEAMDSAGLR